jgi:heme/copper-type cytochrome/quinol oxidase subunit 2
MKIMKLLLNILKHSTILAVGIVLAVVVYKFYAHLYNSGVMAGVKYIENNSAKEYVETVITVILILVTSVFMLFCEGIITRRSE